MKRTFTTSSALLAVLLCCTFTAAAPASAPHATVTANSERAFHIDMATNRALLNVSPAAVSRAEKRERTLLTTCLTRDLVQITEASSTHGNAEKALELIGEEAGVEYEMAAIRPVLTPLLNGVHRLLTLHLPAALRSTAKGYLAAFARVQSLNACADGRTWLAGGLAAGHEPRGTAQIATTVTAFHRLTNHSPQFEVGVLPPAQFRALKLEKARAGRHINQLIAGSVSSLDSWIKRVAADVQRTATTTTTTTTSTGTTPTTTVTSP